jgi:DNA-3-methyladenine glycosylase
VTAKVRANRRRMGRAFFDRSPEVVARQLLGKVLRHNYKDEWLSGRIVEVEAYLGLDDPASHAFIGQTERNRVLFGPPGVAYVYLVYGMYYCLNVSCLPVGKPGGVLFRANRASRRGEDDGQAERCTRSVGGISNQRRSRSNVPGVGDHPRASQRSGRHPAGLDITRGR